jgi:hypothetical protein
LNDRIEKKKPIENNEVPDPDSAYGSIMAGQTNSLFTSIKKPYPDLNRSISDVSSIKIPNQS